MIAVLLTGTFISSLVVCSLTKISNCLLMLCSMSRYKYKFLRATTSNIPASVLKDNRGSKLTIGRGGMLKIQHLVSVGRPGAPLPHGDNFGQPSRIAYIEFYVKPEEDDTTINDS